MDGPRSGQCSEILFIDSRSCPGMCISLYLIVHLFWLILVQEVIAECGEMSWGQFKPVLTDALIAHLQPIQVPSLHSRVHVTMAMFALTMYQ